MLLAGQIAENILRHEEKPSVFIVKLNGLDWLHYALQINDQMWPILIVTTATTFIQSYSHLLLG